MSEELNKAQSKQAELNSAIRLSEELVAQRPVFHFAVPGGWCNDPNGFSQFNDTVHLFYQYHPYSTQWGPMHWGHVTSKNLLEWNLEPVALAPDCNADNKGCFSGTAIQDGEIHLLAYTGVSSNGSVDVQNQCIAIGDGTKYTKISENPVLTAKDIPFQFDIEHFRDPKILKKDGIYYMTCVIKLIGGAGAMVMFSSKDTKKWTYHGLLDFSKKGVSGMWECPDVLSVDGRDLLIFSPQEMEENLELGFHQGNNSVYMSGKLDLENCIFDKDIRAENRCTMAQIDYGIDFYAPETCRLKDGRTILIGWMQAWESNITPADYLWSGMMTVPRELSFKNNRLYQNPVRELDQWKVNKRELEIAAGTELSVTSGEERHFDMELEMDAGSGGTVTVLIGKTDGENILLTFNLSQQFLLYNRSNSLTPGNISQRKAFFQPEGKILKARLVCDTCSLEVFLDQGKLAFTNAFFLSDPLSDLKVENRTQSSVQGRFWKIQKP